MVSLLVFHLPMRCRLSSLPRLPNGRALGLPVLRLWLSLPRHRRPPRVAQVPLSGLGGQGGQVAAMVVVVMIQVVAILCHPSIPTYPLRVRGLATRRNGSLMGGFSTRERSRYLCVLRRGMNLRRQSMLLGRYGRLPPSTFMVLPCRLTGHGITRDSGCRCYRVGHLGTMSSSLWLVRTRLFLCRH